MQDSNRNYITVSELNFYLKNILKNEELLQNIYILGEVSGASNVAGNLYFTLKDDTAQISACCFGVNMTYCPSNGEMVLLFGSPDFYEKGGKVNFIVRQISPFGLGKLHIDMEKLKVKLKDEGLFDDSHKKPIPKFPINIGVVTSLTGAVIKDIISTVRKHNNIINILIIDSSVQGENAPKELIKGLTVADTLNLDVIILARGGGSYEDLIAFNDENLAYTIYNLNTPIISAVGHETDFSISDFVADVRALTPTAAAEMIAFDTADLAANIISKTANIGKTIKSKLDSYNNKVVYNCKEVYHITNKKLEFYKNKIAVLLNDASHKTANKIGKNEQKLGEILATLNAKNPANVLSNGYFKVSKTGVNINSVKDLAIGDIVNLYGADGCAKLSVIETIINE